MPVATKPDSISVPDGVPLLLRDLIHDRTGLHFDQDRLDLLVDKLHDRVVANGCQSYLDYYYLLKYDEKNDAEWLRVMDAFSVQETYFWREPSQLDALVRHVVPRWFAKPRAPLHIWSAACATGEEPFSIVMALHEAGLAHLPVQVHASDASEAALARAQAGVFRERSFRALRADLKMKYFQPRDDGWQISPEIRDAVRFSRANLVAPAEVAPLARAGVIFCRNVFIYFSPEAISRTIATFAAQMAQPGHLFVGASESLLKLTNQFELTEIDDAFVYVRKPQEASAA